MYNWSINTTELSKNRQINLIWKLEQSINFGLGKTRLSRRSLVRYLPILDIDGQKKKYLQFLLS